MNKQFKLAKNLGLKWVAAYAGGIGGLNLACLFTQSAHLISLASTAGQWGTTVPVFLFMHKTDNKDLYYKNLTFQKKVFWRDMGKLWAGSAVIGTAYSIMRYGTLYYLQRKGYEHNTASFICDSTLLPLYYVGVHRVAVRLGLTRSQNPTSNQSLEKIIA
ncbi:MAG: hypothetical protein ABIF10_05580 [Candidatus Woesearchaeota archaeon]